MTTPLHFATAENPLYGVYHAPASGRPTRAVLMLNPWGWEALRAHRTLKMLATQLSAVGCASLRFDYSGTGDSWGETPLSTTRWLEDVEWAIEELLAVSGQRKVDLVGLRLGALLAVEAWPSCARHVDRLVCWEPPRRGDEFLLWMEDTVDQQTSAFPVPEAFAASVADWSLDGLATFHGDLLMIGTEVERISTSRASSVEYLDTTGHPRCWVEDRNLGAGVVPTDLIEQMVQWLIS